MKLTQPMCPACGYHVELDDLLEQAPPIPVRAWPARWTVTDGERTLWECPSCEGELDARVVAVMAGLPPSYPWDKPLEGQHCKHCAEPDALTLLVIDGDVICGDCVREGAWQA